MKSLERIEDQIPNATRTNNSFARHRLSFLIFSLGLVAWPAHITSPTSRSGTSIIAIKTKDRVLLVADSRIQDAVGLTINGYESACKIYQYGSIFAAFAGLEHAAGGFDPSGDVRRVAREGGSARQVADRFVQYEKGQLIELATRLKAKGDPALARPEFQGTRSILEAVFVGKEGGKLALYFAGFLLHPGRNGFTVETNVPGESCSGECLLPLGHRKEIQAYRATHPDPPMKDLKYALSLIQIEVKGAPEDVAPPFAALEIQEGHAPHWVAGYQGECPAIKAASAPVPPPS